MITGLTINYNKHCTLQFRTYVQVHEPHYNSLMSRAAGAIALRQSGNAQGCNHRRDRVDGKITGVHNENIYNTNT